MKCVPFLETNENILWLKPVHRNKPVIAIDGPAGSGKSTVAKMTARLLGYQYLDTGAMYRTATLISMKTGISPASEDELCREIAAHDMKFDYSGDVTQAFLDGENVSEQIRSPELTRLIGPVCELPGVRNILGSIQRNMGKNGGVVLEGRDIGTVIFPDAEIKIYLDAATEVRAKRRWKEQLVKGVDIDYEEVLTDLIIRDSRDMNRKFAPLRAAENAVVINTTLMKPEEVAAEIAKLAEKYMESL